MPRWRYADGRCYTGSAATDEHRDAITPTQQIQRCAALTKASRNCGVVTRLHKPPPPAPGWQKLSAERKPVWSDITLQVLPDGAEEVFTRVRETWLYKKKEYWKDDEDTEVDAYVEFADAQFTYPEEMREGTTRVRHTIPRGLECVLRTAWQSKCKRAR